MIHQYLFTQIFETSELMPLSNGIYIYGSLEERSDHILQVCDRYDGLELHKITETEDGLSFEVNGGDPLPKAMASFYQYVSTFKERSIYLDITGLSHSIWAPILKTLVERVPNFRMIYVEPYEYSRSLSTEAQIYDLSEKTRGLKPIAGFANLSEEDDGFTFVPLLGFEGARFMFMIDTVDPIASNIFPVIGVPGFRPEYPFYTYECNKRPLKTTSSWKRVRYSPADCPFSLCETLNAIRSDYPNRTLKVGMIGTKPHAVGAVVASLMQPEYIEILHDHPIRKQKRTVGVLKKHLWDIGGFINSRYGYSPSPTPVRIGRTSA